MIKTAASRAYWDNHWKESGFDIVPAIHPLRSWIEKNIPDTANGACIEIGCFPGKFLAIFGQKGYTLSGIDFFPGTTTQLPKWLNSGGFHVGDFYEEDFFTADISGQYDIVSSFGFVEHFENLSAVIARHVALAHPGGTIILDVPNLASPPYSLLYRILEPEVLKNHVRSVMNKETLERAFEENGCTIRNAEYVGNFYFRFVTKHNYIRKLIENGVNLFTPILNLLPRRMSARYIGIIATKNP